MKIIIKFFSTLYFLFFFQAAFAGLDAEKLKLIKNSSVYITVESGESRQSGSGFLIHKDDESGIVVTNAHVANLNPGRQKIHVIFNSGTHKEKKFLARIISLNHSDDLALLKLSSEDLPEVITLTTKIDVIETDELYMIGFPFGSKFSTNRENPLVTISKGIISSKRLDINDQIFLLQIDGDINPGNSGGPIVDGDGELVGISVATVKKTNIGFAIPQFKVINMLDGAIGNLRIIGDGKNAKFVADIFDPFQVLKGATLIVSEFDDENILDYMDEDNRWMKIDAPIFSSKLKIKNETYIGDINKLSSSEKRYLAQIVIKRGDDVVSYQPPFRMEKGKLSISLEGPNVWDAADESVLVKIDEKEQSDRARNDEKLVDDLVYSILINSGQDAFIKNMSEEPESFFEDVNENDDEIDPRKQEFVDKFVEIIRKDWSEDVVVDHYITSIKSSIEIGDLRRIESLFNTPGFRELHMSVNDVAEINLDELERFIDEFDNKELNKDKIQIIKEIHKARNLSEVVLASFEVTNRSVITVMNELAPKSRHKEQKFIEQDVNNLMGPYERVWDDITYQYMLQTYQDISVEDLKSYLKLLKTDYFQKYINLNIFSKFLTMHMLSVEKDVAVLMSELQREQLGLENAPVLKGLGEDEIIQLIFDSYGKGEVIDVLIAKTAGEITIDHNGSITSTYGKPRKELVTIKTVLTDLEKINVTPREFANFLEDKLVDERYTELSQKKWRNATPYSR